MQVILFENIEKLGLQGDVVNVAPGYYRNFLGPRGMGVEASEHNLKRLELKRKKLQAEAERQLAVARDASKVLSEVELHFVMKATEGNKLFGSLHDHEIAEELAKLGHQVERRQIALKEPIKTAGKHDVRIRLLGQVDAHIKITIEAEGRAEEEAAAAAAAEAKAAAAAAAAAVPEAGSAE